MDQRIESVVQWLKQHRNQAIRIQKSEDGDIDITKIRLDRLTWAEQRDPDDYVAPQSIMLHGEGIMLTNEGEAPLPGHTYEIAMEEPLVVQANSDSMRLDTDRCSYIIDLS